jgi:uncharacterized spore protein YtfJ
MKHDTAGGGGGGGDGSGISQIFVIVLINKHARV